jgi:NifU-like protein involved in Fe-S cluster formation
VSAPLYTTDILRLAASIPHHARLTDPQGTSEKRSPVCGSRVTVDLALGPDGRVSEVGLLVRACALGQASAALLGAEIIGRTPDELAAARDRLTRWLAGEGELPDWPGMEALVRARDYPARHASIRLAFEAAAEAAAQAARERLDG